MSDSDHGSELDYVKHQLLELTHRLWKVESELLDIKAQQSRIEGQSGESGKNDTNHRISQHNTLPQDDDLINHSYNDEEDLISYDENQDMNGLNITSNSTHSDESPDVQSRMIRLLSTNASKEDKMTTESSFHNTSTIHMFAIAAMADAVEETEINGIHSRKKRWRARLYAFLSLMIMSVTLIVLYFVMYESSVPTCSTHAECQIGSFCDGDTIGKVYRKQRCSQCSFILSDKEQQSQCDKFMMDDPTWHLQSIDHTVLWYDRDGVPNYNESFLVNYADESSFLQCLALKHCQDNALAGDSNLIDGLGYLDLHLGKLSADQIAVLFFIALLYGSIISGELIDAATEDATLTAIAEPCATLLPVCFKVIQTSLRLRQLVLPWFVGAASAGVLLTDTLSPKNALLNCLAVSFLIEADKMLAHLLLTSKQQSLVERAIFSNLRYEIEKSPISTMWSLILGSIISIAVVVIVCGIEHLMAVEPLCGDCTAEDILTDFILVGTFASSICWALSHMKSLSWESIVAFLLEFSRGHSSSLYGIMLGIGVSLVFIYDGTFWIDSFTFFFFIGTGGIVILNVAEIILARYSGQSGAICGRIMTVLCFVALYWTILSWVVVSAIEREKITLDLYIKPWARL